MPATTAEIASVYASEARDHAKALERYIDDELVPALNAMFKRHRMDEIPSFEDWQRRRELAALGAVKETRRQIAKAFQNDVDLQGGFDDGR